MSTRLRDDVRFNLDDFITVVRMAQDSAEAFHKKKGIVPFSECKHEECAALKRIQQTILTTEREET